MEDVDGDSEARRVWQAEDRAKISLMHVFRSHFEEGRPKSIETSQNPRLSTREGITETQLREHIDADLGALLSTVRLDSCFREREKEPGNASFAFSSKSPWREEYPYLAKSILNYGFCDLSDVTQYELQKPDLVRLIRESLIAHEPRLIASSIKITVRSDEGRAHQRLSLFVEADLIGDPVDISMDFDADVDLGAGKMRMSSVRVQL